MSDSIAATLACATAMLRASSDSARADAWLLLAHALQRERSFVVAHGDDVVAPATAGRFYEQCERRRNGVPVAYIVGTAGFYGREFSVDSRVLVPRPETESLIVAACEFAKANPKPAIRALDVGTGSGAIACTLAAELPGAVVDATDCSADALTVARANARRLGVAARCEFVLGDLAAPFIGRRYDVVIANLPYVESSAIPAPPEALGFEPRLALDGGPDGLRAYARFLPELGTLLAPSGLALLEAGSHQIARLAGLARAAFEAADVGTGRDLGGADRFVTVRAPAG